MDEDEKRRRNAEKARAFRAKNTDYAKEYQRRYKELHPERVAAWEAARPKRYKPTGRRRGALPGEAHPGWKGDNVSPGGAHAWMVREFGKPSLCDRCGTTVAGCFDWANKDHTYRRDRSNWLRLCRKCHIRYDAEHNNRQVGRPPRKKE